ncbi:MAG: O-antigen ligase family protein [Alicyclobacillus sp.]|nr:O-antigen ligase family protein [Alicyclobacillus sp.]
MQLHTGYGLDSSRLGRWSVYAIMAFPLVDFALRHTPHLSPLGSVWSVIDLLILAVLAALRWLTGYRPTKFAWTRYAGWYTVYLIGLTFAGLSHPAVAFDGLRADLFYLVFALLIPFVVEPRDVPRLLHAAVAVAMLVGVDGIYQYIAAVPIPSGWVDVSEHVRTRVFSIITSPNELGAYMALMVPLLVGLCLYERNRWRKLLYGFGAVVCFGTHLVTYDRGSLLALVGAIVIVAALVQPRLLIVVVVLGVIGFFLPPIHHRFMDLFSPVYLLKAEQGGRLFRWGVAYDTMSANPLFGAGIGRYGGQVASDFGLGIYSDNYYMKVLGESGLLGLVLFIAMHIALLREVFVRAIKCVAGRRRTVAIGGFIGLVAVVLHNTVENVFEFGPMTVLYFSLAVLYILWAEEASTAQSTAASEAESDGREAPAGATAGAP